jgi:hypothetical protein
MQIGWMDGSSKMSRASTRKILEDCRMVEIGQELGSGHVETDEHFLDLPREMARFTTAWNQMTWHTWSN